MIRRILALLGITPATGYTITVPDDWAGRAFWECRECYSGSGPARNVNDAHRAAQIQEPLP